MKNEKNQSSKFKGALITIFLITSLVCLLQTKSSAACYLCIIGRGCGISNGSCSGPHSGTVASCEDLLMFHVNVDYIQKEGSKAWIVQGDIKIPLVSDKLSLFITSMNTKYNKANKNDKNVQRQIESECIAFLKTDDGNIGAKRLALISEETGLKVRENAKK